MSCFYCKGKIGQERAAFMVELDKSVIVIKNVPTNICADCGLRSYSDEVFAQVESMVQQMRGFVSEIAVVQYSAETVA